jgi:hypothetical protein
MDRTRKVVGLDYSIQTMGMLKENCNQGKS